MIEQQTDMDILSETFKYKKLALDTGFEEFSKWSCEELRKFFKLSKPHRTFDSDENLVNECYNAWRELVFSYEFALAKDCADSCDIDFRISPIKSISKSSDTLSTFTPTIIDIDRSIVSVKNKSYFKSWTVPQLQDYLSDRGVNKSGNKQKLVDNVYGAHLYT